MKILNRIKQFAMLITMAIICFLLWRVVANYGDLFAEVEHNYNSDAAVNLNGRDCGQIDSVLLRYKYVDSQQDAAIIEQHIAKRLKQDKASLGSIYELNKHAWQIPVTEIDSTATSLWARVEADRELLGQRDSTYIALKQSGAIADLSSKVEIGSGNGSISIKITRKDSTANMLKRIIRMDKVGCADVIVRLQRHYVDSLGVAQVDIENVKYAKTGADGKAVFSGLNPECSYSVLPIKEGYEYGGVRGTTKGSLAEYDDSSIEFKFTEQEHRIPVLDKSTLRHIRENHIMTVRSPKEYKMSLMIYMAIFFVGYLLLFLVYRRKSRSNTGIIPIIMLLTGICLVTMFSISDPLTDRMLGVEMAQGVIAGVGIMILLQFVNFEKLYQNRARIGFDIPTEMFAWIFKPYRRKVSHLTSTLLNKKAGTIRKSVALLIIVVCLPLLLLDLLQLTRLSGKIDTLLGKLPKGSSYVLLALLLTLLLFPFGEAVGGMKVNLNLGIKFQPSEIAKYLVVIFMAAFFSMNTDAIVKYSSRGNSKLFGGKLKMLSAIIASLGCLMVLYMLLGDMGPALVLAFTFIILYSIIKSKVDLNKYNKHLHIKHILSCDLAMLLYGVISFLAILYIGARFDYMGTACLLWFALWAIICIIKKQIFESAILFNLIIAAFIFGGTILCHIPGLESIGERLDSRKAMCTNTWGTLPIENATDAPGENTQVAEGLWGLASGGFTGQGLGGGSPHFIPAFHTDMILQSIGEQMGLIGIIVIVLLLALLLRSTIVAGYRSSHPFIFYLCSGIAVVTAVQFIIISLGSTGIIPLTGVTVPFFSYGKVSMILNLAAFGIILSVAQHNAASAERDEEAVCSQATQIQRANIEQYNYPISILCWIYCGMTLFIIGVFGTYQILKRNDILIRPVYVNDPMGVPTVKYNPRIDELCKKLRIGDIYDRNGILLATSDSTKIGKNSKYRKIYDTLGLQYDTPKYHQRFYPFGEHLFFMLGDYNSQLYFTSSDKSPRGYMAEVRHLAYLRGFDNILRHDGKPVTINLSSAKYKPGPFTTADHEYQQKNLQLRDYSALLPYLKQGANSRRVKNLNRGETDKYDITPHDIHLTIDARLQVKLFEAIRDYYNEVSKGKDQVSSKTRISCVVIDANNGDLLASANYPLVDYERLKNESDRYNDCNRPNDWKAYTDMDLGLIYYTEPGSTAKVMSALAGLRRADTSGPLDKDVFNILRKEKIHTTDNPEPEGEVDMRQAIVNSSNCYFIHLVNHNNLYKELSDIYQNVSVSVDLDRPYIFKYETPKYEEWYNEHVKATEELGTSEYKKYMSNRGSSGRKMNKHYWLWAWGQVITASPLSMARVASILANNGYMCSTKFLLDEETTKQSIVSAEAATKLAGYMQQEAARINKKNKNRFKCTVGGKTGTPERIFNNKSGEKIVKKNDGWYIFYIKQDDKPSLAVAIRFERARGSGTAKRFADSVINVLAEAKYINK